MTEQPAFIQRAQVIERLGLTVWQLRKLEAAGTLKPVRLEGLSWKMYKAADVERLAEGHNNGGKNND